MYCHCAHNWNTFSLPASHLEVRLAVKYLHMGAVADVGDLSIWDCGYCDVKYWDGCVRLAWWTILNKASYSKVSNSWPVTTVRVLFLKKFHLVELLDPVTLINLGFLLKFLDFSPKFSKNLFFIFPLFMLIWLIRSILPIFVLFG